MYSRQVEARGGRSRRPRGSSRVRARQTAGFGGALDGRGSLRLHTLSSPQGRGHKGPSPGSDPGFGCSLRPQPGAPAARGLRREKLGRAVMSSAAAPPPPAGPRRSSCPTTSGSLQLLRRAAAVAAAEPAGRGGQRSRGGAARRRRERACAGTRSRRRRRR